MPLSREALDKNVAQMNAERPKDIPVIVSSADPARFQLSFPDRVLPDGQCIDQDFSAIQWLLQADVNVTTGIIGARLDEETRIYHVDYEVVEWD